MKKKRLTIGIQVAVLVVGGALISLAALSYILIRMQSGYAFNQFMERHERLTNLMANEMAPALHLGDGRIIGKKVKAFVSTSEENLILLKSKLHQLTPEVFSVKVVISFLSIVK